MTTELRVHAAGGAASIAVTVPDGWTQPDYSEALAVIFPTGPTGIEHSFATNTVISFLEPDVPAELFSAADAVIADSGPYENGALVSREALSIRGVESFSIVQLTTEQTSGPHRARVTSSVARQAWDRFAADISSLHASVRLIPGEGQ